MNNVLEFLQEKNVKLKSFGYTRIDGLQICYIKMTDIASMSISDFLEFKSKFFITCDDKRKQLRIFL